MLNFVRITLAMLGIQLGIATTAHAQTSFNVGGVFDRQGNLRAGNFGFATGSPWMYTGYAQPVYIAAPTRYYPARVGYQIVTLPSREIIYVRERELRPVSTWCPAGYRWNGYGCEAVPTQVIVSKTTRTRTQTTSSTSVVSTRSAIPNRHMPDADALQRAGAMYGTR